MTEAALFGYWRSSAAYRVRIACHLKGLAPQQQFVHLHKGEQRGPEHIARNPAGLVPVWSEGDYLLSQSLAILEYLDEIHPEPTLLPGDARRRALIREIALDVVADIHPIGNLRVLDALTAEFSADAASARLGAAAGSGWASSRLRRACATRRAVTRSATTSLSPTSASFLSSTTRAGSNSI